LYDKKIFNQEFDVVAYVVEIKEENKINKEDKVLTMKEVIAADPDEKITMAIRLWNWKEEFGNDMIDKVLIFTRFSLKQYKDSISVSNGFRSSITSFHNHPMKKY
jgi:hypothetical protein